VISYNVSGGKMNRGLSVVSACKTFAIAQGRNLSIKVSDIIYDNDECMDD